MSVGEFWPEKGIVSNDWVLNRRDSAPASLSGNSIAVPLGEPYWTIDVTVEVPAKRSQLSSLWSGFFARREGRKNTFTANRSFQSFPFSGTTPAAVSLGLINRSESLVDFISLASHSFSVGDMISYVTENGGYYVGEISEIVSATRAKVVPPPFLSAEDPSLRMIKAVGEFRLDGVPSPVERSARRTWSFKATQVIRG